MVAGARVTCSPSVLWDARANCLELTTTTTTTTTTNYVCIIGNTYDKYDKDLSTWIVRKKKSKNYEKHPFLGSNASDPDADPGANAGPDLDPVADADPASASDADPLPQLML